MTFGFPLPWWALTLLLVAAAGLSILAYARRRGLTPVRRSSLAGLRFLAFVLILLFWLRPVVLVPADETALPVVPVLVDTSRSMALGADGSRFDTARDLLRGEIVPQLTGRFRVEPLAFGERLVPTDLAAMRPDQRRSDLSTALAAVAERFDPGEIAGIVIVSDGGDTSAIDASELAVGSPPVFAIGVGAPGGERDREVLAAAIGETGLGGSVVDLTATVVSHDYGHDPIEIRVLENGALVQSREITLPADGSPVHAVFRVSPPADVATVYTVEIPARADELTAANNRRQVLARPPGRRRLVLMLQGGPGHEHAFLQRAWAADAGMEVDAVVRKGENDRGEETYYIQAAPERTAVLTSGYPSSREALFAYDALVLANWPTRALTTDQAALIADFVGERGGGLLVLGAGTLDRDGLAGSPLEELLPLEPRTGGAGGSDPASGANPGRYGAALTPAGEMHPVTRLGASAEESRARWEALPPLAGIVPLGAPRPGALVLAETADGGGVRSPLVAVQRYGGGRTMIFTGKGAWLWRMHLPSDDTTYETFWRQTARWLAVSSPKPVQIMTSSFAEDEPARVEVEVRDEAFVPVRDASLTLRTTGPSGDVETFDLALAGRSGSTYSALLPGRPAGVYTFEVEARSGEETLATVQDWVLVGGADPELTDPRRNDEVLARLAAASGGQVLPVDDLDELADLLVSASANTAPMEQRDLWHTAWAFLALVMVLATEWGLRRRWGLR